MAQNPEATRLRMAPIVHGGARSRCDFRCGSEGYGRRPGAARTVVGPVGVVGVGA